MPNRLAQETSPYLQQHADNPVDWYPWGEEALRLAREQDRPILLSVGYSACHWCHVMAHESFEDAEIAAVMNRHFVNIKVDREERPDIDQIYQLAHQMLTQRGGGWPLTMFLTPEGKPFFGGTYFPKAPRYNLPGFGGLMERIAEVYREQKAQIAAQNESLGQALARTTPAAPVGEVSFDAKPLEDAVAGLRATFDNRYGGFGGAPKFPHAAELELSLRRYAATGESDLLHMPAFTLERMIDGGIYDQLGGGFCRYSVDGEWSIPHFEKMLYDNGPLLGLLADLYAATGSDKFARAAQQTAGWVMREMQSPEGGYYSTLDADSEGQEGRFYVWTPEQVRRLLTPEEYHVAALAWGLDGPPNFEGSHWHLRVVRDIDLVAQEADKPIAEADALLQSGRAKLFAEREPRVRPGRDEKILTSWNGLMIAGMARAGRVFGRADWLVSARSALAFVHTTLWRDGRLLATCKDGTAHLNGYLDDYAFLLAALLELMQAEFRSDDLRFAQELADVLLAKFEDAQAGGFFFTAHDHEALIHRPKSGQDNATPSGNGVAALALTHLAHLTGETRYSRAAERTLALFWRDLTRQPFGFSTLLMALEEALSPTTVVVLRGPQEELGAWRHALPTGYRPTTLMLSLAETLSGLPEPLAKPARAAVNAWVCRGVMCLPPIDSPAGLAAALDTGQLR